MWYHWSLRAIAYCAYWKLFHVLRVSRSNEMLLPYIKYFNYERGSGTKSFCQFDLRLKPLCKMTKPLKQWSYLFYLFARIGSKIVFFYRKFYGLHCNAHIEMILWAFVMVENRIMGLKMHCQDAFVEANNESNLAK